MDITQRLNDLIVISNNFSDVVEMENKALKEYDTKAVEALLERKKSLSTAYETRMKGFDQLTPDVLKAADPELRDHLVAAGKKLEKAIDENARLLKVSMDVQQNVVDAIAEAVREATPNAGTYGANGTTGYGSTGSPRSVALTLNETL